MATSLVALCGPSSRSKCGYCESTGRVAPATATERDEKAASRGQRPKSCSVSYGLWAIRLRCGDYQALIDRGWRRSGCYLYKPDLNASCCPQFTIRLDSKMFALSKSQFKHVKQLRNVLVKSYGWSAGDQVCLSRTAPINETVLAFNSDGGALRVEFKPATFEIDSFELYKRYQVQVHHDDESKLSEESYKRFLVDTPLISERVAGQISLGSFHQRYFLCERLIAFGVVDILPKCVSSVYFVYDPDLHALNLGMWSALTEIGLAQTFSQTLPTLRYYYLGFYIHNCQKMRYKAQYKPSELLCPYTFSWRAFDECVPLLDGASVPLLGDAERQNPSTDRSLIGCIPVSIASFAGKELSAKVKDVPRLELMLRDELEQYVANVGPSLAREMTLQFQ